MDPGLYRVLMDRRWSLEDLYGFSRAYSRVYDFAYCFDPRQETRSPARIESALEQYPWAGGYSYVNFYSLLHHQIPSALRPTVAGIRYSSPGWMDIVLQPSVAVNIAWSVTTLVALGAAGMEALKRINQARLDIQKQRYQHNADIARLTLEEIQAVKQISEEAATIIDFRDLPYLQERVNDPMTALKVLLAHSRRLADLARYVERGKVELPVESPTDDGSNAQQG
jgi:hypothetical protein